MQVAGWAPTTGEGLGFSGLRAELLNSLPRAPRPGRHPLRGQFTPLFTSKESTGHHYTVQDSVAMGTQEEKSRLGVGRGPAVSEPGGLCTPSPGDQEAAAAQTPAARLEASGEAHDCRRPILATAGVGVQEDRTQPGPRRTPWPLGDAARSPEGAKGRGGQSGKCEALDTRGPSSFLEQLCRICF